MQRSFSLTPDTLKEFESVIAPARLARFTGEDGCSQKAVRLYVWNSRLCEEFYLPLQTAEVAIRNAIAGTLARRYSANWHLGTSVPNMLTAKYKNHLEDVIQRETARKGPALTVDHIVSGLSFGFWVNLLTSRYLNILWLHGVARSFPYAGKIELNEAHRKIDQLRQFRNKVAHHYAIFDQGPTKEYNNLLEVLGWISPAAVWFVKETSNPAGVIGERPRV